MKLTLEQEQKRLRELMSELSSQLVETKADVIKARQTVDEMFSEVTLNVMRRQNIVEHLRREGYL